MDFQNVLNALVNAAVIAAITGIAPAVVEYVRGKVAGSKTEEAVNIILGAVDQTNQTFADELRKDGSFTEEKQKEALQKSLTAALSMMKKNLLKFLEKNFNDVEAWIVAKIEAACKANKVERAS